MYGKIKSSARKLIKHLDRIRSFLFQFSTKSITLGPASGENKPSLRTKNQVKYKDLITFCEVQNFHKIPSLNIVVLLIPKRFCLVIRLVYFQQLWQWNNAALQITKTGWIETNGGWFVSTEILLCYFYPQQ